MSATRIINKALNKKSTERFPSASAMATVIRKALQRDFPSEAKAAGFLSSNID